MVVVPYEFFHKALQLLFFLDKSGVGSLRIKIEETVSRSLNANPVPGRRPQHLIQEASGRPRIQQKANEIMIACYLIVVEFFSIVMPFGLIALILESFHENIYVEIPSEYILMWIDAVI